ncbi:hypothetical protein [Flavobacterium sp.]|uniref:hypothetical protein n=1 Tax=Flavobacterium sp. TaxID=239 RepID=UPI0039E6BFAB
MKTKLFLSLIAFAGISSCVTFKQFDSKAKTARETNYEASIIKKDGTIITGQTLKHKNYDPYDPNLVRVINSDKALTLDGKNYNDSNVIIFQDKKAFRKRYNDVFLIRLVRGKINLYYFDQTGYTKTYTYSSGPTKTNSVNNRTTTFFFEKNNDNILPIGIKELRNAIKDNAAALNLLNSYYPKDSYKKELNIEKLVSVVKKYNE